MLYVSTLIDRGKRIKLAGELLSGVYNSISNILLSTQSALHLAPVFTRHRRFVPLPAPL